MNQYEEVSKYGLVPVPHTGFNVSDLIEGKFEHRNSVRYKIGLSSFIGGRNSLKKRWMNEKIKRKPNEEKRRASLTERDASLGRTRAPMDLLAPAGNPPDHDGRRSID